MDSRIPTGRLNAFLGEIVAAHPHPLRGGKQPRILLVLRYLRVRRSSCCLLPVSGSGYRRFIMRRLRETLISRVPD